MRSISNYWKTKNFIALLDRCIYMKSSLALIFTLGNGSILKFYYSIITTITMQIFRWFFLLHCIQNTLNAEKFAHQLCWNRKLQNFPWESFELLLRMTRVKLLMANVYAKTVFRNLNRFFCVCFFCYFYFCFLEILFPHVFIPNITCWRRKHSILIQKWISLNGAGNGHALFEVSLSTNNNNNRKQKKKTLSSFLRDIQSIAVLP